MKRYKRLLINLKMNNHDYNLIKHAYTISQMASSERLYFLFTEEQLDISDELKNEYPELTESIADFAREKINEQINKVFTGGNKPEITIIIQEGNELDEILKQIRINGIDLVLYDLSRENDHYISISTKLARKAPCSVLLMPEETELNLINMSVAVDFSDYSADAMDAAIAFAKAGQVPVINVLHIYQVTTGYYKTGKSYDEFAGIMKNNAKKRFNEFIHRFSIPQTLKVTEQYILDTKTAQAIKNTLEKNNTSFLVVGARGRGAGAAVMLGSVTEKLIETLPIPILAVKQKNSGLSILDAIFK
ncbi:MAG: universal stress protein [Calditrichaceae bacterium]|nr:universal stress protein [Calditrichaceae bacterium]MBN2708599.1 universal stress protein [Calditrichaceae bacterium]RQV95450.1 MAG: universal stress protein [Calditrichota bacterium]